MFNFNVIDTVVTKYLVVCNWACNNKIFKFGTDKVWWDFWHREQVLSVIVKKSSPKNLSADCRPTVGRQTADSRPTNGQQSADCRPTDDRQVFWGALLHNYRFVNQVCRVPNLFWANKHEKYWFFYILAIGSKQFQVMHLNFLSLTNLFFFR